MTFLVIGGSGKTGGRVVTRLTERGLPVRAVSRSTEIPFDWNDRATWPAALRGVTAAHVAYQPDITFPGAAEAIRELTRLAADSGVRRLVLVSGRGEEQAAVSERTVQRSGLEWTILRCAFFNQNFSEGAFADMIAGGELALPADEVAEPFVDAEDIADVAVAALTEDRHVGELYELTGPRLLTFTDVTAEIAAVTGRPIRYRPMEPEDYVDMLQQYGMPPEEAKLLTDLLTQVLDGRNESLADGVQRALGRPPRDFSDYVEATWKPSR
ncbi:NAD(P)H-binding protein [Thermoactinospora rubra]|uniref:NmrA family NAD(P)-binding protein n=1 Tax=Thermoactinospora rubra TaxID=1088767 RepID=UPI000A112C43|nr:NAD(P)H-binding protein [Thermoactinospora rubra]